MAPSIDDRPDRPLGDGPIVGAVLCGGQSSRFGSDKALAPFGELTVGAHVVRAMRGAGIDPVMAVGGTAGAALGIPTVADLRPGEGPLGGLATALLWAKTGSVLVVPCDMPLVRSAHISALIEASIAGQATVATVDGTPKISLALWPADAGRTLLKLVDGGVRQYREALNVVTWQGVEIPEWVLDDADTPEDLQRLTDRRGQ